MTAYKIAVTYHEGKDDYCVTYGESSQVDKAVQKELEADPALNVAETPFTDYESMEHHIPAIRDEYPGCEAREV